MKRTILFFAVSLSFGFSVIAQNVSFRINGKLEKAGTDTIYLSAIGGTKKAVPVAKDGSFATSLKDMPKGFYSVKEIGSVYVEPGFDLKVSYLEGKGYVYSGKGAVENNLIGAIRKAAGDFLPVNKADGKYKLFDVSVPKYMSAVNGYKAAVAQMASASKSTFFKRNIIGDADAYISDLTALYSLYYGVDSAKQEAFYKLMDGPGDRTKLNIDSIFKAMYKVKLTTDEKAEIGSLVTDGLELDNEELFRNSSMYRSVLNSQISRLGYGKKYSKLFMSQKTRGLVELAVINDTFTNPFIKSYLTSQQIGSVIKQGENAPVIDSLYRSFISNPENSKFKKELDLVYQNYKKFSDNAQTPLFEYEQPDGKMVSLVSLRGKYVYIDVWATWCGPCKREIPYLTEIEEKYKDKNIHFVSLSVDVMKDKQKWRDFVHEHNLKGIQLIADRAFDSDFVRKFNINAIPRFILIDPQGKIVSANAKRPSDLELRKQFDTLLK